MDNSLRISLAKPFDESKVHWRVGSTNKAKFDPKNPEHKRRGKPLAYIDARDVMNRLDEVCGIDGWSDTYIEFSNRLICTISIRMPDGTWVSKSDGADDSDVEGAKGGISDAFKRAAVKWGIGRYLYDVDCYHVLLDEWWRILDSEKPKLVQALHKAMGMQPSISQTPATASQPAKQEIQLSISVAQRDELEKLVVQKGGTVAVYLEDIGLKSLLDMPIAHFEVRKQHLLSRQDKKQGAIA